MNADALSLKAPCKVNLHLRILEKRLDGFHSLESVFALLDFADTLDFAVLPGSSGAVFLKTDCSGPCAPFAGVLSSLPPEKNLVCGALALFREETGFDRDMEITLHKRIPPGSGLGGGSSNAAAALLGLNRLVFEKRLAGGKPLSGNKLLSLASRLGSDVPFFLQDAGAAWVSGRGETVEPCVPPLLEYGVLLAFPPFQSATAKSFALLDESRAKQRETVRAGETREKPLARRECITALGKNPAFWPFKNDFLSLFLESGGKEAEHYKTALETFRDSGALFGSLSGSGSACFGVYGSREEAAEAASRFSSKDFCLQNAFFLRSSLSGSRINTVGYV